MTLVESLLPEISTSNYQLWFRTHVDVRQEICLSSLRTLECYLLTSCIAAPRLQGHSKTTLKILSSLSFPSSLQMVIFQSKCSSGACIHHSTFGTCAGFCMHLCLCKTHSQDCPHGEVAFSNIDIYKIKWKIKICQITSFMSSTMGK